MNDGTLRIDGSVANPRTFKFEDLVHLNPTSQIPDISRFHPNRHGDAVTLESVLQLVQPLPEARYLTLHADRDDFHVSISLDAVRAEGLLVYKVADQPMTVEQGGPFRFLIRNPAACHTDDLDDCANVKYLVRIELSADRGRDTRPSSDAEHEELHTKQA